MRTKPMFAALLATGVSIAAFSTTAAADVGAGVVIGGTIGALVGGPPGWVAGMAIGAAIGEGEDQRNARYYGHTRYADAPRYAVPPGAVYLPPHASVPVTRIAPPPPGFYGVPPDYYAAAPRVVYSTPVYYAPRRYYRYY
jgi:hypothetical protein